MTRTRIGYVLAAAITVALSSILMSLPARSQQPAATIITLKVIPKATVIDLLGSGFSAGDIVLSRGEGAHPDTGDIVGQLTVRCQRTKMAADKMWAWLLCDGELRTPSGKITFSGTRRQGEEYPTGEFAITGGTGDFAAAGGTVSTEDDAARNTWVFEVLDLQGGDAPA